MYAFNNVYKLEDQMLYEAKRFRQKKYLDILKE